MNERLFDKDTGLIGVLAAAWMGAQLADINLTIQIFCGTGAFIIMLPKVWHAGATTATKVAGWFRRRKARKSNG